jgi:hypothetical protein
MMPLFALLLLVATPAVALEWRDVTGGRAAHLSVSTSGKAGFTLLAPAMTGIAFTNALPEPRYRTNQILLNGSGVAAGDVDADGLCDLYFCRLGGPNALYRNLGNWKFENVTAGSGVACDGMDSSGAAFADLDGDSDLDLLVNSVGQGTRVFLNDGKGKFSTAPYSPLNPNRCGTTLALGDIDGDGYLDIYIANYRVSALMDMPNTRFNFRTVNGKREIATVNGRTVSDPAFANRFVLTPGGSVEEVGEPDLLVKNLGGTNLAEVSFTGGAFVNETGQPLSETPLEWGLAAMFRDMNGDSLPDLYVCNDFDSTDEMWLNIGGGRFKEAPRLALRKNSLFSMAIDFADINRDGLDDFFVLDMLSRQRVRRLTTAGDRKPTLPLPGVFDNRPQYMMNTLFLNRGDGTYAEIAQLSGVAASEWSWAVAFLDVDLDGWEDMLIANGHQRAARHMDYIEQLRQLRTSRNLSPAEILESRNILPRLATANIAFRNRCDLTFADASTEWGFDFVGVSNGMALADLDNDGDQDVVVNNLNDPACVYRNNSPAPRLAVRLHGKPPNTQGVGARITVSGGPVTQSQEIVCGGRYLSSDQLIRVFAAGNATSELTIRVQWRKGQQTVVTGAKPNQLYEIVEAGPATITASQGPALPPRPLFQDASKALAHTHHEEVFNDFEHQPHLPNKLSQLGPGVAWADIDDDGDDDLMIGSGRDGQLGVYRNAGGGNFQKVEQQPSAADQCGLVAFSKLGNGRAIMAAVASYENPGGGAAAAIQEYDTANNHRSDALPPLPCSVGPICVADIDADGDLDLFVGGRVLPGKYPQPADSYIFKNNEGAWQQDVANSQQFQKIGLVSGAVFSDMDDDGDPDLVLACEWGAVLIFRNEKGVFFDMTSALGMDRFLGWWNGVATGDFDSDGKPDIVASNWGRNTRYQSHREQPLRMYYGDLDGSGGDDLLEAHFDSQAGKLVPERGLEFMAKAMPFVRERFQTHEAFANASVEEIFGERLKTAKQLQANCLETTVFLNRGKRFEAHPLPLEAQMSPAFGIAVADFDSDGMEDIFLSQNFFATQPETPRYDAGAGLLLRGDGRGGFTAVSPTESGIAVYGEQRGCAVSDYDADGRVDLVVTQNGAATRLFRNAGAERGLRVRLAGSPRNPDAIGASLRAGNAGRFGAVREVQCGSGYWSQNSTVQVFARPVDRIHVRWPDGESAEVTVPSDALEIVVEPSGTIRRIK